MSFFSTIKELLCDLKMKAEISESFRKASIELDLLKEDSIVYKLVGPILVRQDPAEPNANVRKRVGYLTAEWYVSVSVLFSMS
ncbi:putative prefoldin subunit 6, partial [Cucurbita argyrosperma subsp. sororia]